MNFLEMFVPRTKPNQRKVLRSACAELQVRGVRRARRAMRGGLVIGALRCGRRAARCADCLRCNALRAGWLHSRGAMRCTGCDAMRCALVAMQCAARSDALRTGCDAMRCAGWLHSRGAGDTMLFSYA